MTAFSALYAQWSLITYTITYLNSDGTELTGNSDSNPANYTVETPTFTLQAPTAQIGFSFSGWRTSLNGTPQKTYTITKGTTGNKTLYAIFEIQTIKLTLNCNNFANQNYFIYVYQDEKPFAQIAPQNGVLTLILPYSEKTYSVQFVFGYYVSINFTALINASANNRKATLTTFADTTITYLISTPNISGIIV